MGCRSWEQIWPKFYQCIYCFVCIIVPHITAIYRESIVLRKSIVTSSVNVSCTHWDNLQWHLNQSRVISCTFCSGLTVLSLLVLKPEYSRRTDCQYNCCWHPGPHFNIKIVFPGDFGHKTALSIMGIPKLARRHLYIETGPRVLQRQGICNKHGIEYTGYTGLCLLRGKVSTTSVVSVFRNDWEC